MLAAGSLAIISSALPAVGAASEESPRSGPRAFAAGSGSNQFLVAVGHARLSLSALVGAPGRGPGGHVRAKGDPDGPGPTEPFAFGGEVTCIAVSGNRAAIKYRFSQAKGSGAPFQDGGVQIFIEDNGEPRRGEAVDRTTFDPPQPAGAFDLDASRCDDPSTRPGYDTIESGNYVVRGGATP